MNPRIESSAKDGGIAKAKRITADTALNTRAHVLLSASVSKASLPVRQWDPTDKVIKAMNATLNSLSPNPPSKRRPKSITTLGVVQITIYTLTGSLIYAFVGKDVQSPALLSAGSLFAKVAFGIALPVIFISGSINTTVACRYIHGRIYQNSVVRFVNTTKGWVTWLTIVALITILAWVIAEAVPFFSELLAICGALLVSGFSFYVPPVLWFFLLKEGRWYERHNLCHALLNLIVFLVGITILGCGLYASVTGVVSRSPLMTTMCLY